MKTIAMATLAVIACWVAAVEAQTMRYTDERGAVHYVGSPDLVPEQYRANATSPSVNKRPIENGAARLPGSSDPTGEGSEEDPAPAEDP